MTASASSQGPGWHDPGDYPADLAGLWGPTDHVQRMWEDQLYRFAIRTMVARQARLARSEGHGLRILDIGCGLGRGWRLLRHIPIGDRVGRKRHIIGTQDIDAYHGIDACAETIEEAAARLQRHRQTSFSVAALEQIGGFLPRLQPADLYVTSATTMSELDDEALRHLLGAIAGHQSGPCAIVLDVLGQHSLAWPCHWGYSRDATRPRLQPYDVAWMYPQLGRDQHGGTTGCCVRRFWAAGELLDLIRQVPHLERRIRSLTASDRGLLVGRHMDTGRFGRPATAIRRQVNALFAFNQVADLDALRVPMPDSLPGIAAVDQVLGSYVGAWNLLVDWFSTVIAGERVDDPRELCQPDGPLPVVLSEGLHAIAECARHLAWFDPGDAEANLLQPQFALLLRQLEVHMQQGLGCGHALTVVLELDGVAGPARPAA